MKILNKTISAGLATIMLLSSVIPASADSTSAKEEVIYIMANADGSVDGVYAVNIFDSGNITDYGNYDNVKMLNTSDEITTDGDKITFSTNSEKAYMQGTLTDAEIPWNISIKYFLDGEEMTAEEIAGKSGKLEIKFKITKNENCKTDFYNSYALQASFTLDTNLCKNITADGATIANVGSDKQLSYTILPDKGIDTTITSDVQNFEMSAVSINGIKLSLDIEVDDSIISDEVTNLTDGIDQIDDGASAVSDGTGELKEGGSNLKDGSAELTNGVKSLDNGVSKLSSGVNTLQSGLNQLNSQSENLTSGSSQVKNALVQIQAALNSVSADTETLQQLTTASGQIKSSITQLKNGAEQLKNNLGYAQYKAAMSANGLDIDSLTAGNSQAIQSLTAQISQLNQTLSQIQGVPGYEEQVAQIQFQIAQLTQIVTLLNGNNAAISGTEQYLNSFSDGISQLYSGLAQLESSYSEFDNAINQLADTLRTMLINISSLSDGINTLTAQYSSLDSGIHNYTSGVGKIVSGYSQITSGVSELASGSKNLVNGSKSLDSGVSELYNGITELNDGANELSDGTSELKEKTSGMDVQIEEKIDEVISSIKGSDSETVSFVSEKNTNVESVQFVIKTDAIEITEEEKAETAQEEELTFWQKLLRLFGLY